MRVVEESTVAGGFTSAKAATSAEEGARSRRSRFRATALASPSAYHDYA